MLSLIHPSRENRDPLFKGFVIMGCSAIIGAVVPGFFLSSWLGMLLWGVIAPKFGVITISYVDSMLITISLWIVIAPLVTSGKSKWFKK